MQQCFTRVLAFYPIVETRVGGGGWVTKLSQQGKNSASNKEGAEENHTDAKKRKYTKRREELDDF